MEKTNLKLEDFDKNQHLLFKCIAGSQAYGLATSTSDTDIKGIFVLPREQFYGLDALKPRQVNDETHDIVFYELGRFIELLLLNNPGILEMLAIPEDCILFNHPLFDLLKPEMFISKLCCKTFAGYAFNQVKRARGLNKKIVNPMAEERLGVPDFCYVIKGQGTIPLKEWLEANGYKHEYCGLASIPHMKDVYGIYYDQKGAKNPGSALLGFRGIIRKEVANSVCLSSIPKGMKPSGIMSFNKDAYTKYCRDYKDYWDWVTKRNDARFRDTVAHGKNYDAKNMMHTFRLLYMAEEIARYGKITVRRPNREELLDIKKGKFMYDELVATAEAKMRVIEELYEESSLPDKPDRSEVNRLLVEIRQKFYASGGSHVGTPNNALR
jgi:hypothetical protein